MTAERKTEPTAKTPSQPTPATTGTRKAWKPRSPVEVVLEQTHKQEKRVSDLQQDLDREKASLNKLLQAKKVLES
jgi:hypothetical protein